MRIRLLPARLSGAVAVPPSKSLLHRQLICQALSGELQTPPARAGEDVERTAAALEAIYSGKYYVNCGESGSTLRLLLPVAMALGRTGVTFTGAPRLLQRPVPAPLPMERTAEGWRITGPLTGGAWRIPADETSQVVSGLLLALPLLPVDSDIMLTTKTVSRPYIEMTAAVMARHGVTISPAPEGWRVPGGQTYAPAAPVTEGDWSAAAWYTAVNALQGAPDIQVTNCALPSLQGDSRIVNYVNLNEKEISVASTPDLLPVLALWGALQPGRITRLCEASFLRRKESDRLAVTAAILSALGAQIDTAPDGLTVRGTASLRGGVEVDSCGDHRMAMLAAFGALFCREGVTLRGADCVAKSYPDFWRDYRSLGGRAEEMEV